MFEGIEDRPGRSTQTTHSGFLGLSLRVFVDRHELRTFLSHLVHLMKGMACFDRSAIRREGSIMALHTRYLVFFSWFWFTFLSFSLFIFFSFLDLLLSFFFSSICFFISSSSLRSSATGIIGESRY
ncbi:hypothetical protein BDV25DRAFT_124553 [Aspergillus avenaceus]|uniref:Uncharacterized protein n=1 Tax=Aspergillus avenaceus TaxID=36643 RepID=A0A5N6TT84_ASPAV|nr:hypothetical protein BDV25DRAFT_124553 [Aspergillus avenaceus]